MNDLVPFSPSRLDITNFLIRKLQKYKKKYSILDVGCGRLYFYKILYLLKVKGNYLGIDIDPSFPKDISKDLEVKILKRDFLKLRIQTKFDVIVCLWVLEHIKDNAKTLSKISNLIKDNGLVIVAVPSIWSWPVEFGRHGYHYYSKNKITNMLTKSDFEIVETYSGGGLLGLVFMLLYSWPRFVVLIPALFIYFISKLLGFQISWKKFSGSLINTIFYSYHKYKSALTLHNRLVSKIVEFDNKFKIFPASFLIIAKKNGKKV
jgi:SAM-dependent methyltransferase